MTFLELKRLVSYWVDDLDFGYFTEIQVGDFINNALREIQKYLVLAGENYYLRCVETQIVNEQADYVLPQDFMKLNRLEMVYPGQSVPCTIDSITLNQKALLAVGPGEPLSYFLKKGRIVLVPKPNSLTRTLRLFYTYRIPELVEDAEVPDLPAEYHEAPAIFAAYDCLLKDGRDPSTLLVKKQEYIRLMKEHADERTVDQPREVVVTEDYGYGTIV